MGDRAKRPKRSAVWRGQLPRNVYELAFWASEGSPQDSGIPLVNERDVERLRTGMQRLMRQDAYAARTLGPWMERVAELAAKVAQQARGEATSLSSAVFHTAVYAGSLGVAPPPQKPPADHSRTLLAEGLELLRRFEPERAAILAPWAADLTRLGRDVAAVQHGRKDALPDDVYQLALRAGRAGTLLEREKAARPVAVPDALKREGAEIRRIQARFYAAKCGEFFSGEMLLALGPTRVKAVIEEVRKAGVADEGPAWALRQKDLGGLIRNLLPTLKREVERDQGLG